LGGMGPQATVDLQSKIISLTEAKRDQDHCDVWVANLASIPDRLAAIRGTGTSPLPILMDAMQKLAGLGVGVILMPCNTAHYWYEDLRRVCPVPFIHIADAAVRYLPAGARRAVVLGTAATLAMRFYDDRLAAHGLKVEAVPQFQPAVDLAIAAVKAGDLAKGSEALAPVLANLVEARVDAVVLACTELPIAASGAACAAYASVIVDPTLALAAAGVAWAESAKSKPA
jgi:aspartate racemase